MKEINYIVKENYLIAKNTYKMILEGDSTSLSKPGQFINIKLDGFYLRRPLSVCDYSDNSVSIIYKVVGNGTKYMKNIKKGFTLNTLVGLGNGFDISKSGNNPVLIGGGVGIPPMYNLAKKLIDKDIIPTVILGFNTKEEVFYEKEFLDLGVNLIITTVDGSYKKKGFVTDALKEINYSYFFTCGPLAMFKAIDKIALTSGQYSFEERMGCGFGACMGCSCKTKYKNKRICIDGPVLEREEIIW